MTTQPTALRLAQQLEAIGLRGPVAAELRRLHAENLLLRQRHRDDNVEYTRVLAQRDALLEALKTVEWHGGGSCWIVDADKIAAAIKAAEDNA